MKRPILIWPNPKLFEQSKEVSEFGAFLTPLVDDMIETMKAAKGVGLSAIQIGVPQKVMVLGVEDKREVYVNPKISIDVDEARQLTLSEGCLSVPGFQELVLRWDSCSVDALNENGEEIHVDATGLRAHVIQHEFEHLCGQIFLEHISFTKRDSLRQFFKKASRSAKKDNKTLSQLYYGF